jgi:hypothetical protein
VQIFLLCELLRFIFPLTASSKRLQVRLKTIGRPMNNCASRERFVGAAVAHLLPVLPWLVIVAALNTGCTCTAISNHQWVGRKVPKISLPEDIAKHLRQSVNGKVGGFARTTGFLFAPFKRMGIVGWSDLGYDGEITGVVIQAAKSTDHFYTVDIKLETLQIDGKNIPLTDERYLRAEICLRQVKLTEKDRPKEGEIVWMRGRMVWDGDGFVEIHPRNAAEVRKRSP